MGSDQRQVETVLIVSVFRAPLLVGFATTF